MGLRKKMILLVVLMSYFLTALNVSIVLTGVNHIMEEITLSPMALGWVQNGYVLAFGGFILLGGKLGDMYGRRPVMAGSLLMAGLGSALAGLSWDAPSLIAARIVQGTGAAILAPTSLALLMDTFKGKDLVKAIAWYSSISGLGASVGLVLGGVLADFLSWRAGFALTVPVAAFMLMVSLRFIPKRERLRADFDWLGTALSVTGVFSLVYAMNGAASHGLWCALAAVLLAGFLFVETRAAEPVMPLSLFGNPVRRNAYAARFVYLGATFSFWFYISLYLQRVQDFSPLLTGLAFLPMTLPQFAAAVLVPGFIRKRGDRWTLFLSGGLTLAGFAGMTLVDEGSGFFASLTLPLILLGFGQGFALSPLTNYGLFEADGKDRGAASGLVNVSHQIGGSVGLSVMLMLSGKDAAPMAGFHNGMLAGLVFVAAMLALTARLPKRISV